MAGVFHPRAAVALKVLWEDYDQGAEDEVTSFVLIPRSASIERNGYADADTAEVVFDRHLLSVDPRTIGSIHVVVHLGTVASATAAFEAAEANARFYGYADLNTSELGEEGEWVTLRCRDLTGVLIDAQWPGGTIPVKRIDRAIDQVLSKVPAAAKLREGGIVNRTGGVLPTPAVGRIRKKYGRPFGAGTSCWEVIQALAAEVGLRCFVEGEDLVLAKPATLFATDAAVEGLRTLMFGHNLERLGIERDMARKSVPNVRVTTYPGGKKKPLVATWPSPPRYSKKRVTKDGKVTKNIEYEDLYVADVTDMATLRELAEAAWEDIGRKEIKVSVATRETTSLEGESEDLLSVVTGTPLRVAIRRDTKLRNALETLSRAERVQRLVARGYEAQVAAVIARRLDDVVTIKDKALYTRLARLRWEASDGFSFEAEAVNFIWRAGSA